MMRIGDRVITPESDGRAVEIVDIFTSTANGGTMCLVRENGEERFYDEVDLVAVENQESYSVEVEFLENVVIAIVYDHDHIEIARGHGHIIHNGAEGILQALSYAFRSAYHKAYPDREERTKWQHLTKRS